MTSAKTGVSFVVPVRNGAEFLRDTLASILEQADGRPFEIVVIDDGSCDESPRILDELAKIAPLHLIRRGGHGAAAAINAGIHAARFPLICQVDQDVRLRPGWMRTLTAACEEPGVVAAQGRYVTDERATWWARAMSLDLEQRYLDIGPETDHVCTGNTVYRADALREVGLFDETLGYGYDNDMSYRLADAGGRLRFCPDAQSLHAWREGLSGYTWQQYGFGYGRLDVVAKHPSRLTGDRVSPALMMIHPLAMLVALGAALAWSISTLSGFRVPALGTFAVAVGAALFLERVIAGFRASRHFRDRAAALFPLLHLWRDLVWVAAAGVWALRRVRRRGPLPEDSMHPRAVSSPFASASAPSRPAR